MDFGNFFGFGEGLIENDVAHVDWMSVNTNVFNSEMIWGAKMQGRENSLAKMSLRTIKKVFK